MQIELRRVFTAKSVSHPNQRLITQNGACDKIKEDRNDSVFARQSKGGNAGALGESEVLILRPAKT